MKQKLYSIRLAKEYRMYGSSNTKDLYTFDENLLPVLEKRLREGVEATHGNSNQWIPITAMIEIEVE